MPLPRSLATSSDRRLSPETVLETRAAVFFRRSSPVCVTAGLAGGRGLQVATSQMRREGTRGRRTLRQADAETRNTRALRQADAGDGGDGRTLHEYARDGGGRTLTSERRTEDGGGQTLESRMPETGEQAERRTSERRRQETDRM